MADFGHFRSDSKLSSARFPARLIAGLVLGLTVGPATNPDGASESEQRISQPRIAHVTDVALKLGFIDVVKPGRGDPSRAALGGTPSTGAKQREATGG